MALNDLFDGPRTTSGESLPHALPKGNYVMVVQGVFDGAEVVISGRVFFPLWSQIKGLKTDMPSFRAFTMCESTIKATLLNAGPGTSVSVSILDAGTVAAPNVWDDSETWNDSETWED